MIEPRDEPWILIVDDNEMDIELTLEAFATLGLHWRVDVVTDGQSAIDHLTGSAGDTAGRPYSLPSLVLLDLKMPGVDGFEVLRTVKALPIIRRVPIVVMTSSREEADLLASYDFGANSYLLKPSSLDDFIDVVRTLEHYWHQLNQTPDDGQFSQRAHR